jgi:hypothetical protein
MVYATAQPMCSHSARHRFCMVMMLNHPTRLLSQFQRYIALLTGHRLKFFAAPLVLNPPARHGNSNPRCGSFAWVFQAYGNLTFYHKMLLASLRCSNITPFVLSTSKNRIAFGNRLRSILPSGLQIVVDVFTWTLALCMRQRRITLTVIKQKIAWYSRMMASRLTC